MSDDKQLSGALGCPGDPSPTGGPCGVEFIAKLGLRRCCDRFKGHEGLHQWTGRHWRPASPTPEQRGPLERLSREELANVPRPSKEALEYALDEGRRQADALEQETRRAFAEREPWRASAPTPEQPARKDDQKALRAAALEEAARLVELTLYGGRAVELASAIRALAGSPAGEGREDKQELLGKKGGE